MIKIIALTLLIDTTILFAQNNLETYCNARFGFCINYDQDFGIEPAPDNGDGRIFYDRDGFKMTVFGSNNITMTSLKDEIKFRSQNIDKVTYQKIIEERGVVSGYKNNNIVYIKILKTKETFNILIIEYPKGLSEIYSSIVRDISTSFKSRARPVE